MGVAGNVHYVITLQWKKPANYLECKGGPVFVGVYKLFSEKFSKLHSASVFPQLIRRTVIMVDSNKVNVFWGNNIVSHGLGGFFTSYGSYCEGFLDSLSGSLRLGPAVGVSLPRKAHYWT